MATGEWGGLTEVSKGKWRIRYSADIGDGRGYMRHTETFRGGVRAAKRRLAELRTLYDTGAARTRVPTFDELWERDVLPGVLKLAPNTKKTYLCTWKLVSEARRLQRGGRAGLAGRPAAAHGEVVPHAHAQGLEPRRAPGRCAIRPARRRDQGERLLEAPARAQQIIVQPGAASVRAAHPGAADQRSVFHGTTSGSY